MYTWDRIDLAKNRLDIGLFIPTIKVEAKYDLKGNLLLLPLVGVGDAKLYLSEYIILYYRSYRCMNNDSYTRIGNNIIMFTRHSRYV